MRRTVEGASGISPCRSRFLNAISLTPSAAAKSMGRHTTTATLSLDQVAEIRLERVMANMLHDAPESEFPSVQSSTRS
jgi:hypothetical protein